MAEQLDFNWVYGINPLATFRMLTRLEHLTEEAQHLDHRDHSVLELRERDGIFRQVSQRRVDLDSGALARLFAGRPVLTQTLLWQPPAWDGSRRYDLDVRISGVSVTVVGGGELLPDPAGSRLTTAVTIEASGRLAGRRTEQNLAEALTRTAEQVHAFRLEWIERQTRTGF